MAKLTVYGEYGQCPHCGSLRLNRSGIYRRKKAKGEVIVRQRYICLDCHKLTIVPVRQLEMALCTG